MAKMYCNPTDFCGYRGCGQISEKSLWKERKVCDWDNLLVCPLCGKAGTGIEIDKFNYWMAKDAGQKKLSQKSNG